MMHGAPELPVTSDMVMMLLCSNKAGGTGFQPVAIKRYEPVPHGSCGSPLGPHRKTMRIHCRDERRVAIDVVVEAADFVRDHARRVGADLDAEILILRIAQGHGLPIRVGRRNRGLIEIPALLHPEPAIGRLCRDLRLVPGPLEQCIEHIEGAHRGT